MAEPPFKQLRLSNFFFSMSNASDDDHQDQNDSTGNRQADTRNSSRTTVYEASSSAEGLLQEGTSTHSTAATASASATATSSDRPSFNHVAATPIDIGVVIGKIRSAEHVSDFELRQCLENRWSPTTKEQFPFSMKGPERRYLNTNHLQNYSWLAVSRVGEFAGAWCSFCALFSTNDRAGNHGSARLGALVRSPLNNFGRLTGKEGTLAVHAANSYHIFCAQRANEFLMRSSYGCKDDVRNLLSTARNEAVKCNRQRLASIVETILFCGRQNLPLRGHRDSGPIDVAETFENDGNFRALLRFRISAGDKVLDDHCLQSAKNARYTSPKIQNEILDVALQIVRARVVQQARQAVCWSLLADETMDHAKRELMVVVLRYVTASANAKIEIHEQPVYLFDALRAVTSAVEETTSGEVRLTGANIAALLKDRCQELGLDLSKCVGQGYDGASNLSSAAVGAAAEFQKGAPLATYYHCMMHTFNLCASQSVNVTYVRNCLDKVRELASFFSTSAKRHLLLDTVIFQSADTSSSSFKQLCTTRFIERHDAIITALDLLPLAQQALQKMTTWESRDARSNAVNLLNSISKFDFIVTLQALAKMSALMIGVSRALQRPGIDIIQALSDVALVERAMNAMRDDADTEFSTIFKKAAALAEQMDVQIGKPRTASRSVFRPNAADDHDCDAETFFRVNMFLPLIEGVSGHLRDRFGMAQRNSLVLSHLIPAYVCNANYEDILPAIAKYNTLISSRIEMECEFTLWKVQWTERQQLPLASEISTAAAALEHCSPLTLPNIRALLTILATLPVTTAEAERVFSKVERTATAARAHMTEDRLEALVMLSAHRDKTPSVEEVVDTFASCKARRVDFLL